MGVIIFSRMMREPSEESFIGVSSHYNARGSTSNRSRGPSDVPLKHESQMQITFKRQGNDQKEIRNHKPIARGNQIIKVTEIELKDRIVKIIDTFDAVPYSQATQQNIPTKLSSQKRRSTTIFRRLLDRNQGHTNIDDQLPSVKIPTTKNTIKNIMRLFEKWLQYEAPPRLRLDLAFEQLILENKSFNSNMVVGLSKNSMMRRAFLAFSQYRGEEAIGKSQIHSKETHFQALKVFQKIFKLEEQKCQKKPEVNDKKLHEQEAEKIFQNTNSNTRLQIKQKNFEYPNNAAT